MVEVVQLCHKHEVIHRDLKPENFLFANKKDNSPLKAIGFGFSIFFKPAVGAQSRGGQRWSLTGMTALVTGGTRGIGHAIVNDLAAFGATVYTCSRTESELNSCFQQWQSQGFSVKGVVSLGTGSVYAASKCERVLHYSSSNLLFHEKDNIMSNCVVPWATRTPLVEHFLA